MRIKKIKEDIKIAVFHVISEVFSQKWLLISKNYILKNKNVSLIFGKVHSVEDPQWK